MKKNTPELEPAADCGNRLLYYKVALLRLMNCIYATSTLSSVIFVPLCHSSTLMPNDPSMWSISQLLAEQPLLQAAATWIIIITIYTVHLSINSSCSSHCVSIHSFASSNALRVLVSSSLLRYCSLAL